MPRVNHEGHATHAPQYQIRLVRDATEHRKMLHLRYMEYCVRMRSLSPEDYPDHLERDGWDNAAVSFNAYHNGRISGCTRLVRPSVGGRYLMERCEPGGEGFELPLDLDRARTLESSRLIAHSIKNDPALGTVRQWFELLGRSCEWSLGAGFTHWVVASQEEFYQARQAEGWPFVVLGEPTAYHNTVVRPVILPLRQLWSSIFQEGRVLRSSAVL